MKQVILCPIEDCTWTYDVEAPTVDVTTLAGVFGIGVFAAVTSSSYAAKVEKTLENHLETHSLLQWVQTVRGLRDHIAELKSELERMM